MKYSFTLLLLVAALFVTAIASGQAVLPKMTAVDPMNGKIGAAVTVTGENMDGANIKELYLTDGKKDFKVKMDAQAATEIKFTIPAKIEPGRYSLMVLTTGKDPKLIEQPVKVTVEE